MKTVIKSLRKKTKSAGKKFSSLTSLSNVFNKTTGKVLVGVAVVLSLGYFAYGKFSNSVVVSQSEIVRRVSKHVELPKTDPLSVVRVDNAENLRNQNNFYKNVNEGDYILAYRNIVVVYDLRNDKVGQVVKSR